MELALKVMTKDLILVGEDASLDVAFTLMKKNNVRHLPVTNSRGHVVGMISDRDLQRAMKSHVIGSGVAIWESCEFDPSTVVANYMSWPVKTVDVNSTLKSVTDSMVKEKLSCFLVTKDSQVMGILTTEDLLKYLAKILGEDHSTWKETLADVFSFEKTGAYAQALADVGI
jgi:CBS domain-containing protein